ncbi:MAG: hypothetical protein KKD39_07530, partial [Candidatus Altiarchaeota archaeon]|nr:hypothetical protein [Candidatus Altiarchaeota archaeon]
VSMSRPADPQQFQSPSLRSTQNELRLAGEAFQKAVHQVSTATPSESAVAFSKVFEGMGLKPAGDAKEFQAYIERKKAEGVPESMLVDSVGLWAQAHMQTAKAIGKRTPEAFSHTSQIWEFANTITVGPNNTPLKQIGGAVQAACHNLEGEPNVAQGKAQRVIKETTEPKVRQMLEMVLHSAEQQIQNPEVHQVEADTPEKAAIRQERIIILWGAVKAGERLKHRYYKATVANAGGEFKVEGDLMRELRVMSQPSDRVKGQVSGWAYRDGPPKEAKTAADEILARLNERPPSMPTPK